MYKQYPPHQQQRGYDPEHYEVANTATSLVATPPTSLGSSYSITKTYNNTVSPHAVSYSSDSQQPCNCAACKQKESKLYESKGPAATSVNKQNTTSYGSMYNSISPPSRPTAMLPPTKVPATKIMPDFDLDPSSSVHSRIATNGAESSSYPNSSGSEAYSNYQASVSASAPFVTPPVNKNKLVISPNSSFKPVTPVSFLLARLYVFFYFLLLTVGLI